MHFSQTEMFDNWKVKKELPSRKRNEMFHTFLKEGIEGKQAWNISISRHNVLSLSPNTLDSDLSRSTSQLAILSCNKKKKKKERKRRRPQQKQAWFIEPYHCRGGIKGAKPVFDDTFIPKPQKMKGANTIVTSYQKIRVVRNDKYTRDLLYLWKCR